MHSAEKRQSRKKLVLVVGATGAQGLAVIDKLLAPCPDGTPSPYAVRALTRDPSSRRAKLLTDKGVECVKGKGYGYLDAKVLPLNLYWHIGHWQVHSTTFPPSHGPWRAYTARG